MRGRVSEDESSVEPKSERAPPGGHAKLLVDSIADRA